MKRGRKKPLYQIRIANERIAILFKEAKKTSRTDPLLAKRYVRLARRIGMRYNVRINNYKRTFCKKCNRFFTSDRRRLKKGRLEISCKDCNSLTTYPYKKKQL